MPSHDALGRAEQAALQALKAAGTAGPTDLAKQVGVSRQAMRRTLGLLAARGLIEIAARGRAKRLGRPALLYRLSEAGEERFPRAYDHLASTLVGAIAATLGESGVAQVLRHITDQRIAAHRSRMEGKPLAARIEVMRTLYAEDDPYMEVVEREDGYLLRERNCPFARVAREHPALCATSVATLSALLERPVRRELRLQDGDGLCAFFVPREGTAPAADAPVLPEPPRS